MEPTIEVPVCHRWASCEGASVSPGPFTAGPVRASPAAGRGKRGSPERGLACGRMKQRAAHTKGKTHDIRKHRCETEDWRGKQGVGRRSALRRRTAQNGCLLAG